MSKILITAERRQLATLLEKGLQRQGWETVIATSRDEIKNMGYSQPINLMILDLDILGGNNLNLLQEIRSSQKQLPILIITKYDELGDRSMRSLEGFGEILLKPFHLKLFIERVRVWLSYESLSTNPSDLQQSCFTQE